jgi:hypothetical protein
MHLERDSVHRILERCLLTDAEMQTDRKGKAEPKGSIIVEGIHNTFVLSRNRLRGARHELALMLEELDDEFKTKGGGGWSVVNACTTKDGRTWGKCHDMEILIILCIGAGLCHYPISRSSWPVLPGGMPYLTIDSKACARALH